MPDHQQAPGRPSRHAPDTDPLTPNHEEPLHHYQGLDHQISDADLLRIDQTIDTRGMDGFEDLMMLDPITQRYDYQAIIVKLVDNTLRLRRERGL